MSNHRSGPEICGAHPKGFDEDIRWTDRRTDGHHPLGPFLWRRYIMHARSWLTWLVKGGQGTRLVTGWLAKLCALGCVSMFPSVFAK